MSSPLSARDGNAGGLRSAPAKVSSPGPLTVSGEALLSSMGLRALGDSGVRPTATLSVASALSALRIESRHEVVALLPASRSLQMNYANWHRLRDEAGGTDDAMLVISILGAWRLLHAHCSHAAALTPPTNRRHGGGQVAHDS